ncbi:hypothetical protein D7V86_24825 [bacterium D16-51]|nr:hypothetical protein D7V96_23455 [bacterium D16-59]RKI53604.1 hypothetical protein D7V86_24825 [bacterium D16-51]
MIKIFNSIRKIIGMDANYFYPALITFLIQIVSVISGVIAELKNRLLELYQKKEFGTFCITIALIQEILMGTYFLVFFYVLSLLGRFWKI